MRLAIMQPYFLPYIGYFQLILAADLFVVYDNIKYTKKGWINRNRILANGTDSMFTLPLKKDSDHLNVVDRELSTDFERQKLLQKFKGAYQRAPFFAPTFALLERIVLNPESNLFRFLFHSIDETCRHLDITTKFLVSSQLPIDHSSRGQDKVLAICHELRAETYLNPIGGTQLYSKDKFADEGIKLQFLSPKPLAYPQFGDPFVPWLSIVDVMMFNPPELISDYLRNYELG